MATGLRLPVGVNSFGGLALVDGETQARKVIGLALAALDSEHAFQQDIGLGSEAFVFDVESPALRATIKRRLVEVFADFERQNLFRLVVSSIRFSSDSVEQTLTLDFRYINLESDEEETFRQSFGQGA